MKSPLLDLTKPLVDRLARPVRYVATDAFLPKPVEMNELTEKIKQAKASRMILAVDVFIG